MTTSANPDMRVFAAKEPVQHTGLGVQFTPDQAHGFSYVTGDAGTAAGLLKLADSHPEYGITEIKEN